MNMTKVHLITQDGLQRLQVELEQLRTEGRESLAERLNRAFEDGQDDEFVDNAELEAARHEQSFLEGRILELETILANHEIIDQSNKPHDRVQLGDMVTIVEKGTRQEESYLLVGAAEADPVDGRVSNESPLGQALLDAKVGSMIKVDAPGGEIKFRVKRIG